MPNEVRPVEIDDVDRRILTALPADARIPTARSPTSVFRCRPGAPR